MIDQSKRRSRDCPPDVRAKDWRVVLASIDQMAGEIVSTRRLTSGREVLVLVGRRVPRDGLRQGDLHHITVATRFKRWAT